MIGWEWLTKPVQPYTGRFLGRVLGKATVLFVILNVLCALTNPLAWLGRWSLYNYAIGGRERLPYAENPDQSYNLSLNNLDALFAAHVVSKPADPSTEFRVVVIGDSSVWGVLLDNKDTLVGQLNRAGLFSADGRPMVFYNLGYPVQSVTKDVLILDYALQFKPDMVLWLVTLESFAPKQQLLPLMVRANPQRMQALIQRYQLPLDPADSQFISPTFWGRTIVGQRRELADMLRLQLYGPLWAGTHIDQVYPNPYVPRMEDFQPDAFPDGLDSWHTFSQAAPFRDDQLALPMLAAGVRDLQQRGIPVLVVNEPIFISSGLNHAVRYDFFYPRWAYDRYRQRLAAAAVAGEWHYMDAWDSVAATEFTDSAVHLTPDGTRRLAEQIAPKLAELQR